MKDIFTRKTPRKKSVSTPPPKSGEDEEKYEQVKMGPLLKIAVGGVDDEMVWAVDSKHAAYCRIGVTTDFPIGTEWVRVSVDYFAGR